MHALQRKTDLWLTSKTIQITSCLDGSLKKNRISELNSLSHLPSSEQMNQCVPLAHYLACSAKQRTSGLRQRIKHGLGSGPVPLLSSNEWMCAQTGQTASMNEPAVGRVSGDSHCSGPTNLPLWLSAFAGPPLTQIASTLWLNHQRGASFHRLLADEYLSCKKGLFVTS